MPTLDELDARLLLVLVDQPRISIVELARRLGVVRATAQARLDRLVARGVLRGQEPSVEPTAIGYPVLAFTTLETSQGDLEGLVEHLRGVPEVLEVHTISGPGDVLCRVVARSNQHLQEVIASMLQGPSTTRASTHIALSTPVAPRSSPLLRAAADLR